MVLVVESKPQAQPLSRSRFAEVLPKMLKCLRLHLKSSIFGWSP